MNRPLKSKGFVSSCFELAERDVQDAQAVKAILQAEWAKTPWWRPFKLLSLLTRIGNTEAHIRDAKREYQQLFH